MEVYIRFTSFVCFHNTLTYFQKELKECKYLAHKNFNIELYQKLRNI